jgi:hypothetical protein
MISERQVQILDIGVPKIFVPAPILAISSGSEEVRQEPSDSLWTLMLITRY